MTQFFQLDLAQLGLATSQGQLLQQWLQAMQAAFPGYSPASGNPEYIQAQVIASWAADLAQLCAAGSTELFRQFGTQLLALPYQNGTSASTVATVTAVDTAGYTLPTGTQLTLTLNGAPVAFQTSSPLTIPQGSSSGTVTVIGVSTGSLLNGASGPAELVSQINWVQTITVAGPASGGIDQEDDDQYVQRLAATLQLMAPRPITAPDFATMAINFTPQPGSDQQQVGRAAALDGYDPASNTYGNEREVTVCVTDSNGVALNTDTMYGIGGSSTNIITSPSLWGVAGWLQSLREVNFIVNVIPPAYTPVYVACQLSATSGYTTPTVQANVQAALLSYLSPQNFGLPAGAQVGWTNSQTVYRSKVLAVIQNTAGVDHVESLALDVQSPPGNTSGDLALPGAFPLPISTTASIPLGAITVVS